MGQKTRFWTKIWITSLFRCELTTKKILTQNSKLEGFLVKKCGITKNISNEW